MAKDFSGRRLFLLYSFPCADGRFLRGHIDREHLDRLVALIKSGGEPTTALLRYCFPHAVRRLREFAQLTGTERWALSTVAAFWRHHHGHTGDCRVTIGTVAKLAHIPEAVILTSGLVAINPYFLPALPGDRFYMHFQVLVEKVETEVN